MQIITQLNEIVHTETPSKIDVRRFTHVAIDAEWDWTKRLTEVKGSGRKQNTILGRKADYILVQLAFSDDSGDVKKIVCFKNKKYPDPTDTIVKGHRVEVINVENLGIENLLERFELPKELTLLMFYSPKDMQGTLGESLWREMLIGSIAGEKQVTKRRRLNVKKFLVNGCCITVKDLIGMFNSSLDKALKSVGIDNPYKSFAEMEFVRDGVLVKRDKGRMGLFATEDPNDFLRYGVGDVIDLHKAMLLKIEQTNEILEKAFGFKDLYTSETMKLTSGSLVADVFEQWLIRRYPDLFKAVSLLTTSNSSQDWGAIKRIKDAVEDGDALDLDSVNKKLKSLKSAVHGLAAGSIRAFYPGNYGTGTVSYGAIVQGGRCINEQPDNHLIRGSVLDIDLSSCYGSALRNYDFPFGLPSVYCKNLDNERLTLGEFLKTHEAELVNGLYEIYVDGSLTFHQDLIHSKYNLDTKRIASQLYGEDISDFDQDSQFAWDHEIETTHIVGDFLLTTKQIEKGIITTYVLETIRKAATNKELSEFMNLSVETVAFYPKSKEVSIEEFIGFSLSPKKRGFKKGDQDTRSRKWCRLPLEEFIGKFITVRKNAKKERDTFPEKHPDYVRLDLCLETIKKERDTYPEKHPDYVRLDLFQQSVKLFINTTYGCFAAPYFPMGNTILANNITAKARVGVWMVAKALNTVQSITDGGLYNPDTVHYLKTDNARFRKPGFDSLYLRNSRQWSDSVNQDKLFEVDVIDGVKKSLGNPDKLKECQDYVDSKTTEHINNFWSVYGLSLPFEIEHKLANTGTKAAYSGSGDYAIATLEGDKIFIKSRGSRSDDHPKRLMLKALLLETSTKNVPHTFLDTRQLGVSQYQQYPGDIFLPGDDIEQPNVLKPRKYSGKLFETYHDWELADKAHGKAVSRYEKENVNVPLEQWTRFTTIK